MDCSDSEAKSDENVEATSPAPLSDYAKKLDQRVKKRYEDKIAAIGIDPVLLEGKHFEPDCLPPVEATDILSYLVLETSYYMQKQFKAFRSLEAYNQMVSGFIASVVEGHIVANKFVVLAKVRHSRRMNDSFVPIWIITEREGTILCAHCLGGKAGLAESCSHIASVLFYLEAWTKINGRLSCTQVKCTWLLYVKQVDYGRVRDINFTSAKKMKSELDAGIDNVANDSFPDDYKLDLTVAKKLSKEILAPSKAEMEQLFAELSKSKNKPIALSLIPEYAGSYVCKSCTVPTIKDLFENKYLDLTYPDLLKVCQEIDINITTEQITQVERDTITQAKGTIFFKHRAERIGASQCKAACNSDPQTLIQSICYTELNKINTKAVLHGCKHEELAIRAYEEKMK